MTRHTSDPARIARSLKGIEGRLSDLEENLRGRDDPVSVARNLEMSIVTFVDALTIRVYNADDVVTDDWDSLSETEKWIETAGAETKEVITRDFRTTTDEYHRWISTTMGRSGDPFSAKQIHVGDGDPTEHSTDSETLQNELTAVNHAGGANTYNYGEIFGVLDPDELTGENLQEFGVETRMSDVLVALAGFEDPYVKGEDEVITIRFRVGFDDNDSQDGVITDSFKWHVAQNFNPSPPSYDPILSSMIGEDPTPDPNPSNEELDDLIEEVPVTGIDFVSNVFSLVAFVDSSVAIDTEITEFGLTSEEDLVTHCLIDPPVDRSRLENLTIETTIRMTHETS